MKSKEEIHQRLKDNRIRLSNSHALYVSSSLDDNYLAMKIAYIKEKAFISGQDKILNWLLEE